MAGTRKLVIEILGNAKDASQAFGDVRKQSEITKERLDKFGTAALGAGVAIAGGLAFAIKEFVAADEQSRKLDNSIRNSTNSFTRSGDAIRELSTELQNLSGADGDALVGASALAVQWGLSESQISQLLPLVNDLSLKMGVDVDSAMKAVLKSTSGSSMALKKMGIDVDAARLAADPFGTTMEALKGSVQGFGAEVGATSGGQLNILKQQLGDLVEAVGGGALDVFGPVIKGLTEFVNGAGPAGQAAGDIAGKVLSVAGAGALAVGGLVKLKGAVDSARDAMTTSTGAANAFGKAAGALGAVGAAFVVYEIARAANSASIDLEGATAAMYEFQRASSAGDKGAAIVEQAKAVDGFFTNFRNGIDIIFGGGAGEWGKNMAVAIDGVLVPLNNLDAALSNTAASGNTAILAQQVQYLRDNAQGGELATKRLNEVLGRYDTAVSNSANKTRGATRAQGENTTATEAATAAIDEQNAALKALTDPVFGAMRAQQQNTQAQEKYAEAAAKVQMLMAAGRTGSAEFAQALRGQQAASIDAGSAAVNQQSALATLGGAMQNGTVSGNALNAKLRELVASGQLSAGAAMTLGAAFSTSTAPGAERAAGKALGLTAAVNSVPGSKTTTFVAETGEFKRRADELISRYGLIGGLWKFMANPNASGGRDGNPLTPQATGGTVLGDRPYLVGERGPEVIVPGSGYVIPTRRLVDAPTGGSGGGGSSITVNVNAGVGDPVAIGRTVVESLKAYERTNGTAWRN